MRNILFALSLFLLAPLISLAQTPTLVQHVTCPNSAEGTTQTLPANYYCSLPEPSQAGNTLLVGVWYSDLGCCGAPTVTDDKSNIWTTATSAEDNANSNISMHYALNVSAGTRRITVKVPSGAYGNVGVDISEYYNINAIDKATCNTASGGTSITAGSLTPTVSGDLLWQFAQSTSPGSTLPAVFVAGSQSNINWQLEATSLWNQSAVQSGIYNSISAINPTLSNASTGAKWDSCVMAMKAASAGNAPTASFRIVHLLHENAPDTSSTQRIQFPASGNLEIVSSWNPAPSLISSVTSTPSNTWSSTGSGTQGSQIFYAAHPSVSSSMTLVLSAPVMTDPGNYFLYDVVGAATSPFDVDSGEISGVTNSRPSTLAMCTSCLTPSLPNELIIFNQNQYACTLEGITAPSGGLLDSAVFLGDSLDGPQWVDQNGGWGHYYDPNTSAVSVTWNVACGTLNLGSWAGRVAAFKGGSQTQPLPPSGVTGSAQPQ